MKFPAAVDGASGRGGRTWLFGPLLLLAAACGGTAAHKADSATTDTATADQAAMTTTDRTPESDGGGAADRTDTDTATIPVDAGATTDVAPSMDADAADTATAPDTGTPDAGGGTDTDNTPKDAAGTDTTGTTDGGTRDATSTGDAPLASNALAVRFADSIITRWPDPGSIGGKPYGWDYNIGIVLTGMQKVYERTGDAKYLTYIRKYVDAHVDASGNVDIPAGTAHSLDLIQPSGLLLFLFQQTGAAKYSAAAQAMRARFDTFPKNADGGFWHKQTYPNEMWLDGIYMAEPFLVRYGRQFPTCGAFCNDTAVTQTTLLSGHVMASSGLLVHAWDQDKNAAWANPTTGNSPEVWGRASGWFVMALVDMLNDLPATHSGHAQFLSLLTKVAGGIRATQDPATGLWFQVLDKGSRGDNWLETSGSGMFVYALKVAVDRGYLDASFLTVAQKGYAGLKTKVTTDSTGLPVVTEAVQGMSVQVDYATYVAQMRLSNSVHGLCAILLAASQMD